LGSGFRVWGQGLGFHHFLFQRCGAWRPPPVAHAADGAGWRCDTWTHRRV